MTMMNKKTLVVTPTSSSLVTMRQREHDCSIEVRPMGSCSHGRRYKYIVVLPLHDDLYMASLPIETRDQYIMTVLLTALTPGGNIVFVDPRDDPKSRCV